MFICDGCSHECDFEPIRRCVECERQRDACIAELEAENKRLREALEEYGEHKADWGHGNVCDLQKWTHIDSRTQRPKCTCGLDKILCAPPPKSD